MTAPDDADAGATFDVVVSDRLLHHLDPPELAGPGWEVRPGSFAHQQLVLAARRARG